MRITRLELKNFRLFKDKTVFDLSSLNSLVGKNGSGKTAVLEAISYITTRNYIASKIKDGDFNTNDSIVMKVTFDQCFINKIIDGYNTINVPSSNVILIINRRKAAAGGKALNDGYVITHFCVPEVYCTGSLSFELPTGITSDDIPSSIEVVDSKKFKYRLSRKKEGSFKDVDYRSLSISNELVGFPNVFYFPKDREKEVKKSFNNLMSRIIDDLNWRYIKDLDIDTTCQKWESYYNDVISKVENEKSKRIIKPLITKMVRYYGDKFKKLELSLVNLENPYSKSEFSLRENNTTKQLFLDDLGSGETMILSYCLLKVIAELSKEKIIILIDEPELHLHPQAQHKLFEEIKVSEVQFVLSTHSEIFVDLGNWQSIKRFDRGHQFPEKIQLDNELLNKKLSQHLDEIKKYFHDKCIFFRENNEMLFSEKCLLVEGPADKHGLPVLAQKLDKEWDITIISCNGKNKIAHYLLLCIAFGIDYFVVYDQDSDGDEANITAISASDRIYKFSNSFESELGLTPETPHKATKALEIIEEIEPQNIPQSIKDCIENISKWQELL